MPKKSRSQAKRVSTDKWLIYSGLLMTVLLFGGMIAMTVIILINPTDSTAKKKKNEPVCNAQVGLNYPICKSNPDYYGRLGAEEITITSSSIGTVYLNQKFYSKQIFTQFEKAFYDKDGKPKTKNVQKRRPLLLFGDNDSQWCRAANTQRGNSAGQAKDLSQNLMDRSIAYGIITTFYESDSLFKDNDELFEQMIQSQFYELTQELQKGSDIYIPVQQQNQQGSKKKGTLIPLGNGNPQAYHNLGSGIANLSEKRLMIIAEQIAKLVDASGKKAILIKKNGGPALVPKLK